MLCPCVFHGNIYIVENHLVDSHGWPMLGY